MRICVCSVKEKEAQIEAARKDGREPVLDADRAGWKRGGYDIRYESSKLNRIIERSRQAEALEAGADGGAGYY